MNSFRLILFFAILSTGLLDAQTDFRPGYIIQNSGDTIHGKVDYRGDIMMGRVCKFMDQQGRITEYAPGDIKAFRFVDSKYYVSKTVDNVTSFFEYLIKGTVNIYYLRDKQGDHYYIQKEGVGLVEIPYEEGIRHIDNREVFYRSTRHIGILQYYMQDAPEFNRRITDMKKPEHKNLIKLAEAYNNVVCDGGACIIYEKQLPLFRVNMEVLSGIVNFRQIDDIVDRTYFRNGVIANFWMPRTNEKIYLKTGFMYTLLETTEGENLKTLKIPLHLGYMAPNTFRFRPSLSIGLLSPSYSGGVAVKLNKRMNIGFQTWLDFLPNSKIAFVPGEFFSYSLLGNVYFEL